MMFDIVMQKTTTKEKLNKLAENTLLTWRLESVHTPVKNGRSLNWLVMS